MRATRSEATVAGWFVAVMLILGLIPSAGGGNAVKIPAAQRIEVDVILTLTAPPDQPMHMPTDVGVDKSGRVFVADGSNDRIVRFRADGKFDVAITEPGREKLKQPVGLAVDAKDQLWIADTGHHRLVVVNSDGQRVERVDLPKPEGGRPVDPTDLVVTPDGTRTYVVDNDNHRVVLRDNQTGDLTSIGGFGEEQGQFRWPFMICLSRDGYVYVSEAIGARVQRIGPDDRWAGQLGRWSGELGHLYRPKGVAVGPRGRLYVSDSTLGVVQVFGPRGRLEGVLTDAGGKPLRFEHPMGMCFDKTGHLFVVELKANRVAVVSFAAGSTPASTQPAVPRTTGGKR